MNENNDDFNEFLSAELDSLGGLSTESFEKFLRFKRR